MGDSHSFISSSLLRPFHLSSALLPLYELSEHLYYLILRHFDTTQISSAQCTQLYVDCKQICWPMWKIQMCNFFDSWLFDFFVLRCSETWRCTFWLIPEVQFPKIVHLIMLPFFQDTFFAHILRQRHTYPCGWTQSHNALRHSLLKKKFKMTTQRKCWL